MVKCPDILIVTQKSRFADTSSLAGQNPRTLSGRRAPKTANLSITTPPPLSSSLSLNQLVTWTLTPSYNKASKSCNKNLPPSYKSLQAMTRGPAKRTRMALEDRAQMGFHKARSMGSIKDIRHRMLTEGRRVPGVEGQRLTVRLRTGKMDGTNKEAVTKEHMCTNMHRSGRWELAGR